MILSLIIKIIDANKYSNYTYEDKIVRYKKRIVVGATGSLREHIYNHVCIL
jgi:hypothetical protein